ncbi:MAG: hypothetical protein K0S51_2173 [Bacillales bacterium]|jgi:putative membrane protein|nr:hypothetical protein [Bacillales bacterium]
MGRGGMHYYGGGGGHMLVFGHGLFMLLFYAVIAGVVYYFYKRKSERGTNSSAVNILRERYARGEINTDEYRERFDELTKYNNLPKK